MLSLHQYVLSNVDVHCFLKMSPSIIFTLYFLFSGNVATGKRAYMFVPFQLLSEVSLAVMAPLGSFL
jgi:hypothetical protein